MIRRFLKEYRVYWSSSILLFVVLTVFLILFSAGPQEGPFIYQIY
jgi:hypothetical protein